MANDIPEGDASANAKPSDLEAFVAEESRGDSIDSRVAPGYRKIDLSKDQPNIVPFRATVSSIEKEAADRGYDIKPGEVEKLLREQIAGDVIENWFSMGPMLLDDAATWFYDECFYQPKGSKKKAVFEWQKDYEPYVQVDTIISRVVERARKRNQNPSAKEVERLFKEQVGSNIKIPEIREAVIGRSAGRWFVSHYFYKPPGEREDPGVYDALLKQKGLRKPPQAGSAGIYKAVKKGPRVTNLITILREIRVPVDDARRETPQPASPAPQAGAAPTGTYVPFYDELVRVLEPVLGRRFVERNITSIVELYVATGMFKSEGSERPVDPAASNIVLTAILTQPDRFGLDPAYANRKLEDIDRRKRKAEAGRKLREAYARPDATEQSILDAMLEYRRVIGEGRSGIEELAEELGMGAPWQAPPKRSYPQAVGPAPRPAPLPVRTAPKPDTPTEPVPDILMGKAIMPYAHRLLEEKGLGKSVDQQVFELFCKGLGYGGMVDGSGRVERKDVERLVDGFAKNYRPAPRAVPRAVIPAQPYTAGEPVPDILMGKAIMPYAHRLLEERNITSAADVMMFGALCEERGFAKIPQSIGTVKRKDIERLVEEFIDNIDQYRI